MTRHEPMMLPTVTEYTFVSTDNAKAEMAWGRAKGQKVVVLATGPNEWVIRLGGVLWNERTGNWVMDQYPENLGTRLPHGEAIRIGWKIAEMNEENLHT